MFDFDHIKANETRMCMIFHVEFGSPNGAKFIQIHPKHRFRTTALNNYIKQNLMG